MIDGARESLAGYLYQILGTAGIRARVHAGFDEEDHLTCDLILQAGTAKVYHEVHGQDAGLVAAGSSDEVRAVQFKHSRNASRRAIEPAEMRDILYAFARSRENAALVECHFTGFILVTNRPLSPAVPRRGEGADSLPAYADLQPAQKKWLKPPPKRAEDMLQGYGSADAAQEEWYEILRQLDIYSQVPTSHWSQGLRGYAREHGVFEEDIDAGLSRLIGEAIRGTLEHPIELSREWLNRVLVGVPDCRSLVLAALGDSARGEAQRLTGQWLRQNVVTPKHGIFRRSIHEELRQKAAQFPVVCLVGDGGCGKSVMTGHLAEEHASGCFTGCVTARDYPSYWLGATFNCWRSREHSLALDQLVDRKVLGLIQLANPGASRPLLLVNIDGIDEAEGRLEAMAWVGQLVQLCLDQHAPPPGELVLLLTTRLLFSSVERTRDDLIRRLTSVEYPSALAHLFGVVTVRDFAPDEFLQAIDATPHAIRERLKSAFQLFSGSPPLTAPAEDAVGLAVPTAGFSLLDSLRHPAMWGQFVELPESRQMATLGGESSGLSELARGFLERFVTKLVRRRPGIPHREVEQALVQVAQRREPAAVRPLQVKADWVTPAGKRLRPSEARDLFHEAVSYGMISTDEPETWRWRHGFVRDYLRTQEG